MANILVCADGYFRLFSPFSLEPYIDGFIQMLLKAGHNVFSYIEADLKHKKAYKNYLRHFQAYMDVIHFKPDIIFAFNNVLDERFLTKFQCPIYIVASDTPLFWHNKECIKKYKDRFNVLYFNADFANDLKTNFGISSKHQLLIPYTTNITTANCSQDKDISFVGNFFNLISHILHQKLFNKLPPNKKQQAGNLLKQIFEEYKTSQTIQQKTYEKLFNISEQTDLTKEKITQYFCITLTNNRRTNLLKELTSLDLHIYTYEQNLCCMDFDYNLWNCCHFENICSTIDNQRIFNESKISLNMPHAQVRTGFSWRTCDIMASNAMLLSNKTKDLEVLFGNIVPTYEDEKDIRDKCLYFLKHDKERQDIVKSCNKIINLKHRYEHLMLLLSEFIGLKQSPTLGKLTDTSISRYKQNKYQKNMAKA